MKTPYTFRFLFLLILSGLISGCQSTPKAPDWAGMAQPADAEYFYAAGEGRSLSQAQKSAMDQINQQLWAQVQSETTDRKILRKTKSTGKASTESYQNLIDSKIKTQSANVTLTGIEYPKTAQTEYRYYVQARIKKQAIKKQLEKELAEINRSAEAKLASLKFTDPLIWYLEAKNANTLKEEAMVRASMLSVVAPDQNFNIQTTNELVNKVDKVKSGLLIYVKPSKQEPRVAEFISELLSQEGINTTSSLGLKGITHKIRSDIDKTQKKFSDGYVTTLANNLITTETRNNRNIANNEIISTASSVSSFKVSSEGSARHFKQQLSDSGIWISLGFN